MNNKIGDKKCFDYSIVLSAHNGKMGDNYNQLYKIKPYFKSFNFENINYPLKNEDYKTFEKNNESIALNVLKANENQDDNLFKCSHDNRENKVYLLLIENKH